MKRLLLLPILGVLLLSGCTRAADLVLPPAASTFRVVAFNAEWLFDGVNDSIDHWGSPARAQAHLEGVADVLRPLDADYIGLAEVEDAGMLSKLDALLGNGYSQIFVQGTDTSTGQDVAALSTLTPLQAPSRTDERVAYPVAGSLLTCGSGTYAVSKNYRADFDLAGTPVTIIGAHFLAYPDRCDRSIQREAQATVLANLAREALARGREVIVLGDLNDFDPAAFDAAENRPSSRVLSILKDLDPSVEGDELVNVCAALPQEDRYTDWYDRNGNGIDDGAREHSQIDFILVSRGLADRVAYVTIAHTTAAGAVSDHWPIVMDLTIPAEVAVTP
ncbi:MAG: endonuclease/exonuclease/phosphatase family protein [Candidatus Bipolaricaulota bacterium]|nr:endonuclease/exonuclease/phosphatase family protein [Candidatus Bipolaricaulota bacterium]